jgi:hypothetical protein
MSQTSAKTRLASRGIKQACRRMQTGWSSSERNRRQTVANRRQQSLWQMLTCADPSATGEQEILAVGAPTIADLARFAG